MQLREAPSAAVIAKLRLRFLNGQLRSETQTHVPRLSMDQNIPTQGIHWAGPCCVFVIPVLNFRPISGVSGTPYVTGCNSGSFDAVSTRFGDRIDIHSYSRSQKKLEATDNIWRRGGHSCQEIQFCKFTRTVGKLGVGPTSPCFQMGGVQLGERKSLILAEFLYSQYCIFFVTFCLFSLTVMTCQTCKSTSKHFQGLHWFAYHLTPPRYVIVYTSTGVYIHQLLVISM